mmetsp:Transcript_11591/g.22308  ORF Transcript_11591/g.22308 Transcript_11591/m.22308 type:complete len:94 (+) Transcript_11591:664-945(+)
MVLFTEVGTQEEEAFGRSCLKIEQTWVSVMIFYFTAFWGMHLSLRRYFLKVLIHIRNSVKVVQVRPSSNFRKLRLGLNSCCVDCFKTIEVIEH